MPASTSAMCASLRTALLFRRSLGRLSFQSLFFCFVLLLFWFDGCMYAHPYVDICVEDAMGMSLNLVSSIFPRKWLTCTKDDVAYMHHLWCSRSLLSTLINFFTHFLGLSCEKKNRPDQWADETLETMTKNRQIDYQLVSTPSLQRRLRAPPLSNLLWNEMKRWDDALANSLD
jgi:hypothetical protein